MWCTFARRYTRRCVHVCLCINYFHSSINGCLASSHLTRSRCQFHIWKEVNVTCWKQCNMLQKQASSKELHFEGLPLTGSPLSPADCREILLPMMTDQLKYHLERQEDLEACCQLLSNILEVLYRKDVVSNGPACSAASADVVGGGPLQST